MGKRMTATREGNSVVLAEIDGAARQARTPAFSSAGLVVQPLILRQNRHHAAMP
jgi:hypothetical protein